MGAAMMTRALLLATLLALPATAWAPGQPDLAVLRETICHWETRGEPRPYAALGADGEIGRCQIKPLSAVAFGARPADTELQLIALLVDLVVVPEPIADAIITRCAGRLRIPTAYRIAACFNGGPSAAKPAKGTRAHEYARQIAVNYNARTLSARED